MESKIFNRSCWIHSDRIEEVSEMCTKLLEKSKFNVINELEHHYFPQGYTKLWLLAESHLALHSFPEKTVIYIELSSCNKEYSEQFWSYFENWSNTRQIKMSLSINFESAPNL
jgi:S-adenosylmethionine decarboxylase